MNFEKMVSSECHFMTVIKGRVAVAVRSDFPGAFNFCGTWYVYEKDFYKTINNLCTGVTA